MQQFPYDTLFAIETPEGIELNAAPAGFIPRALATIIDVLIRGIVVFALWIACLFLAKAGYGVWLLLSFLLEWFYPVFFEVLRKGQTPGKKALNIAVVNDDLTPVSWGASVTRNLLGFVDFLPFMYVAGAVCIILQKNAKRLGDMAAGTLVIYREPAIRNLFNDNYPPKAPAFQCNTQEQFAFVEFIQRKNGFSLERQIELVNILTPITQLSGEQNIAMVGSAAAWFMGGGWQSLQNDTSNKKDSYIKPQNARF